MGTCSGIVTHVDLSDCAGVTCSVDALEEKASGFAGTTLPSHSHDHDKDLEVSCQ